MTASHWEIGRRIVDAEQGGQERAEYGEQIIKRLAKDLTTRFGRGFSRQTLRQMRAFYLAWPLEHIAQTASDASLTMPKVLNYAKAHYALGGLPNTIRTNPSTSRAWRGVALTRLKSRLNADERSIVRIQVGHQIFHGVETLS